MKQIKLFEQFINEKSTFDISDLQQHEDYLVTYKGAEAYMEYKGKKGNKHQFDNSGKITELTDEEVLKHVTKD